MKLNFEQTDRRNEEERSSEERKHTEEVTFLKKTNAQLKVVQELCRFQLKIFKLRNFLSLSVAIGGYYCTKKIKYLSFESKFVSMYRFCSIFIKENFKRLQHKTSIEYFSSTIS